MVRYSSTHDLPVSVDVKRYSSPSVSMCRVCVVRCSYPPSFLYCVCTGWRATDSEKGLRQIMSCATRSARSPESSHCGQETVWFCVTRQRWFPAEVSEISQGWIAKAFSSREGRLARYGKMSKNAQQGDRVERGDRVAVNQRGTTPVAEAARELERLRQKENELMNQYRYRQGTTSGRQSGVGRVWSSLCIRSVCNRDGGKLVSKQALCEEGKGIGKRLKRWRTR